MSNEKTNNSELSSEDLGAVSGGISSPIKIGPVEPLNQAGSGHTGSGGNSGNSGGGGGGARVPNPGELFSK